MSASQPGEDTPLFLSFDTSGRHVAVALIRDDVLIGDSFEEMSRGQAETLKPALEATLAVANVGWHDLTAIGVGVGPGNFTGCRISVSAARGLALGLGIPAVPLSSFELARSPSDLGAHESELVSVEAPRGQAYVQAFRHGRPVDAATLVDPVAPPDAMRRAAAEVTGHRAGEIAAALGGAALPPVDDPLPVRLAAVTAWKLRHRHDVGRRPAPLYVRPADAAPPRDTPPPILP